MGTSVEISLQATEDIQEIVAFIARDSPVRAAAFGDILLRKAESLSSQPWRGKVVHERGERTVREVIHGAYRIIYKITVDPERVVVLRFWHGARGTPQIVED